ncbi:ImpE family T6SS protein Cts1E [Enterobacterales bacterium CwR94]|nr:ImpE family T6SS protein Cts1E [Enterobacterales bacterium CwR94]
MRNTMTNPMVTLSESTLALDEWVANAIVDVKRTPGQLEARWQLVKLYCLQADWDRAMRQLDTLLKIEPECQRQVDLYRNLILSERLRTAVLVGEREAVTVEGALPEWAAQLVQSNALYANADYAQGEKMRQLALENASALQGQSESLGQFEWLADSDDRLGPVCEFICAGGYRWIPFSSLDSLHVSAPKGLNDLVWAPATARVNGQNWLGYIPARYPVTLDDDQKVKAGLETHWIEQGARFIGAGRKMWLSNVGECSLFEAGAIEANTADEEQSA